MRMLTLIAAVSGVALVSPLHAGPAAPMPAASASTEETPSDQLPLDEGIFDLDQNFSSVSVVAIEDLPPDLKVQAETIISQTSAEDLLALQSSVDASPKAASALAAKGLHSSQVVAANVDWDGTLTLIVETTT